jgi:hypothetical protein
MARKSTPLCEGRDDQNGDTDRRRSTVIVQVRLVSLANGLRESYGGHRHMARSVSSIRNPALPAVPLLKLASETA